MLRKIARGLSEYKGGKGKLQGKPWGCGDVGRGGMWGSLGGEWVGDKRKSEW